jgi:transcriptional regulator with XRE-family HTH domain
MHWHFHERPEMADSSVQLSQTDTGPVSTVGADIRALRKARRVSLTELAEAIGRSVGFLSQVERGLSEPSIADLKGIASHFDTTVGFFLGNTPASADEAGVVVRAGHRRRLGSAEQGLIEELISPDLGSAFEVVRSVFQPGAELIELTLRKTQETGFVVSGRFDIEIDGTWFHLNTGDSFHIDHQPFRWRNTHNENAVVIWTIAPPIY